MIAEAAARPVRRFTDVRGLGTASAAVRIFGAYAPAVRVVRGQVNTVMTGLIGRKGGAR